MHLVPFHISQRDSAISHKIMTTPLTVQRNFPDAKLSSCGLRKRINLSYIIGYVIYHIYVNVSLADLKDPRAAQHRGPDRRGAVGHVCANCLDEVEVEFNVLEGQPSGHPWVTSAHDQPGQQAVELVNSCSRPAHRSLHPG